MMDALFVDLMTVQDNTKKLVREIFENTLRYHSLIVPTLL